jgi:hypothetical protein
MATVTRGPGQGTTRACYTLNTNAASHVHGAERISFVVTGGAGERWLSVMQDATVP